jgi:hypothetical protein
MLFDLKTFLFSSNSSICLFVEEATTYFRKAYPHLVRYNEEPILLAFARMCKIFIEQRSITDDVRVFTYHDDINHGRKNKCSL